MQFGMSVEGTGFRILLCCHLVEVSMGDSFNYVLGWGDNLLYIETV